LFKIAKNICSLNIAKNYGNISFTLLKKTFAGASGFAFSGADAERVKRLHPEMHF
jgi:hypothetical protein